MTVEKKSMGSAEQSWISKRLTDAAIGLDTPEEQATAVITAAVAINGGMGVVPFGINMWTFVAVDVTMVAMLGSIYGYHYTNEQAAKLVKSILGAATFTTATYTLALKFFAEALKGVGVFGLAPVSLTGMALDALLCGATTYALGFTTKTYFAHGTHMTRDDLRQEFERYFEMGKSEVRRNREQSTSNMST